VTPAERAILAVSQVRDLCLALRRAFVGPRAYAALREGGQEVLPADELRIAVGLAWAAGHTVLVRTALARLPDQRVGDDPVLAAFRDAVR